MSKFNNKIILFIFLIIFFLLVSCQEEYRYYRSENINLDKTKENKNTKNVIENSDLREKIVKIANEVKKEKTFIFKGLHFNYDCSGFVNYVYFKAGINLLNYRVKNYDNGVERLYRLGEKYFMLSKTKGNIGDIILFDNTVDSNKNGLFDDILTHAAIVIDYDKTKKTYKFAHISSSGWSIGYMNLIYKNVYKKNGIYFNTYLRKNDTNLSTTPSKYLSSNLFNSFLNIVDFIK